jgi:hypothetical protein
MVKWIVLGTIALALGGASWWSFTWNNALILPNWYQNNSRPIAASPQPQPAQAMASEQASEQVPQWTPPPAIQSQLQAQKNTTHATLQLTAQDANQWIQTAIAQTPDYPALQPALRGINTEIQEGQLTTGVVIDTRQLALEKLSPELRKSLESTFQQFPMLKDRELYIGLSGSPKIKNNRLVLDENAQVQLGNMSLPLPQAMKLFGLSSQNLEIPVKGQAWNLKVQNAEINKENLILKGEIVP